MQRHFATHEARHQGSRWTEVRRSTKWLQWTRHADEAAVVQEALPVEVAPFHLATYEAARCQARLRVLVAEPGGRSVPA